MDGKHKQFKDPVHGYISVPVDWCTDFIDTPIFQRLRNIEQTSMRPLFPAAHHDRFIHSLGTLHLGMRLLECLKQNTTDENILNVLNDKQTTNTFLIACLMHDCGHAPFSHTFEGFFNYTEGKGSDRAYELLGAEFPNKDFIIDGSYKPAPHEAFSAVVLKRFYKDGLDNHNCDPELAARMITGCKYPIGNNFKTSVRNQLISLLNGPAIDVDKLDYILRDTWASGVKNTAIDIERLLSAATLHKESDGTISLCFQKSALSVLQNVVDARNYLYEWVYNHHTVLYYSELLDRALRKLAKHLRKPNDPDFFWTSVFSLNPFQKPVTIVENVKIYLPTDGDILHLLKCHQEQIPEVSEILSHRPSRVALWKTSAEFRMLFKGKAASSTKRYKKIAQTLPERLSKYLECQQDDIVVVIASAKHNIIEESDVLVLINGVTKPYTEVMGEDSQRITSNFFYAYISRDLADRKEDIINFICTLA